MSYLFLEAASGLHSVHACAGKVEEFQAPVQGTYKLEVWGAQGEYRGGKGRYSFGKISSSQGNNIYVCCGGAGKRNAGTGYTANTQNPGGEGGYNGGGNGGKGWQDPQYNYRINGGGGGGGCTDIAITNRGELYRYENNKSDILLVAGGGGGGMFSAGGYGGGTSGGASVYTNTDFGTNTSEGASQTNGYKFGIGQRGMDKTISGYYGCEGNGGGGGGWYGGFSIQVQGNGSGVGGGGGSGHVGDVTDGQTLAGDTAFPSPDGGTETGHAGNGWALIRQL